MTVVRGMWGAAASRRAGRIGIFFVCALLLGAAVSPVAGRPRVFPSSGGTVEISATSDATSVELPVLNASGKRRAIRARLVVPAELAETIDATARARLAPSSITDVAFDVTAASLPAGTFDGLAIVAGRRGRPDRRAIRVVVTGAATTKRTPAAAVETLTVVSRRSGPWDDEVDIGCEEATGDNCLPLAGALWTKEELAGVPIDEPIAVLSRDERILLVERKEKPVTISAGGALFTALELDVAGRGGVGTYTGKLDLLPDDEENATVTLTVVVTDSWCWAAVALALGVVLALGLRRWDKLGGKVSRLRSDAAKVRVAFDEAGMTTDPQGAGYTIEPEVRERYVKVNEQIRKLDAWLAIELSDEDPGYKDAQDNVETARVHAEAWGAFRAELAALRAGIAGFPTPPSKDSPRHAKWWGSVAALAHPSSGVELSFEDLDTLRPRVRAAAAALASWTATKRRLDLVDERIDLIEANCGQTLEEAERDALVAASMSANEARWELFNAEDVADLEDLDPEAALAEAERNVARLSECLQARTNRAAFAALAATLATRRPKEDVADVTAPELTLPAVEELDPAEIVWREELRQRRANRLVLIVLLVGLLYAGLDELYFDDDVFGTWRDYLAALTWGLGAVFTLDAVSSAIDKLRGGLGRAG